MIGVSVITLAVLLVVLLAADAKNAKKLKSANLDKAHKAKAMKSLSKVRGQFRDFRLNPLATKVENMKNQVHDLKTNSMERMYLTWMLYSDSMCSDLMLTSTMQLDKCYMSGVDSMGMPQYVWNSWMMDDDNGFTFMQSWYNGHCQSMNAMPTTTTSASFSMSCMPFEDSGMYGMVMWSEMLPARPMMEGLQIKTYSPDTGMCMHADEEVWIRNGFCLPSTIVPGDDDMETSYMYFCHGNGGMMSTLDFYSYEGGMCSNLMEWYTGISASKGMCETIWYDDNYYGYGYGDDQDDDMAAYQYQELACVN